MRQGTTVIDITGTEGIAVELVEYVYKDDPIQDETRYEFHLTVGKQQPIVLYLEEVQPVVRALRDAMETAAKRLERLYSENEVPA